MILSSGSKDTDLSNPGNKNPTGEPNCSSSSAKSIDDVWNDISLSSFHHHRTTAASTTTNHPPPFLDFFSSPTSKTPCPGHSPRFTPPPATAVHSPRFTPPPPAAGMTRSLNSEPTGTNFLYKNSLPTSQTCKCSKPSFFPTTKTPTFNALAPSSSSSSSSLPMKRPDPEYCEKHKKLMKNRESASRSRARKQARADELEIEVERLTKENAKLKSQLQQQSKVSSNVSPAQQQPKRSRLNRTLTAPF